MKKNNSNHVQNNEIKEENKEEKKEIIKKNKNRIERNDSLKRAKDKIYEIAYANDFKFYVTLTIDESKLSRTDKKKILKSIRRTLSNLVQRKSLRYILIPEYHQKIEDDGKKAIHFHGLVDGEGLLMVDTKKKYRGTIPIYNWIDWPYGYTTAIPLDNQKHICQYITKYITKQSERVFSKRYLSGGKLAREVPTSYFYVDYDEIDTKEYVVEAVPSIKVKYMTLDINQEKKNEMDL